MTATIRRFTIGHPCAFQHPTARIWMITEATRSGLCSLSDGPDHHKPIVEIIIQTHLCGQTANVSNLLKTPLLSLVIGNELGEVREISGHVLVYPSGVKSRLRMGAPHTAVIPCENESKYDTAKWRTSFNKPFDGFIIRFRHPLSPFRSVRAIGNSVPLLSTPIKLLRKAPKHLSLFL